MVIACGLRSERGQNQVEETDRNDAWSCGPGNQRYRQYEFYKKNGPLAAMTAGALLIIASRPDRMVHILDKDTGQTLWETELKANADGIPAVYEVGGTRVYCVLRRRERRQGIAGLYACRARLSGLLCVLDSEVGGTFLLILDTALDLQPMVDDSGGTSWIC